MIPNPSPAYIREVSPLLGVDCRGKSNTFLQILFWKTLYKQTAAHVDTLHAAFARLMTVDDDSPAGLAERTPDMDLFLDPFLTGRPFDLIAYRQVSCPPTGPGRPAQFQNFEGT